ncbi:hypothetical protein OSB04_010112 [Centaurea solstitialis]|uniref:type II protein arginine methyltransferase n=1 Tax=Centaurea solstitialis TaxID=347529 RepID=A0AA38TEH0_9ASTR|nr:hypothetical protein OSB04_010112 [Centaurea solstitialis]
MEPEVRGGFGVTGGGADGAGSTDGGFGGTDGGVGGADSDAADGGCGGGGGGDGGVAVEVVVVVEVMWVVAEAVLLAEVVVAGSGGVGGGDGGGGGGGGGGGSGSPKGGVSDKENPEKSKNPRSTPKSRRRRTSDDGDDGVHLPLQPSSSPFRQHRYLSPSSYLSNRFHVNSLLLLFCSIKICFNSHLPVAYCRQFRFFSTKFVGDDPVLVRDFIHSALYHPDHGYFSQSPRSVGVLDRSINFHKLQGRKDYMSHLEKIYKQNDVSWFTPVELFKPWYAHGIAEAILRTTNLSFPLKIYEIGGGSGTCAKGIMDYIMLNAPTRVYNSMSYTSVEISSSLAKKQLETVGEVSSHLSKFKVECRDAADRSGWGDAEQQPCWVIMLEVLDNLPHDLIYSENQVLPWMEVWVEKQQDRSKLSELYKPMQDRLIKSCLDILNVDKDFRPQGTREASLPSNVWAKIFPKPRRSWLPTGCLVRVRFISDLMKARFRYVSICSDKDSYDIQKLLETLHGALPKMSMIAADFSYLPDVKVPGERAPLVSTKIDGSSSDHSTYLDAKGDADIFFPTDFWLLERIDHYSSGWLKSRIENFDRSSKQGKKRRTITLDTSEFMEEFGLPTKTKTKDGYNPLLDDFINTKFYLSVPTHNTK